MYLNDMQLDVCSRMGTKKAVCFKEIIFHAQNMRNVPSSIIKVNWEDIYGRLIKHCVLNKKKQTIHLLLANPFVVRNCPYKLSTRCYFEE